jgi:hypothetical protein
VWGNEKGWCSNPAELLPLLEQNGRKEGVVIRTQKKEAHGEGYLQNDLQ